MAAKPPQDAPNTDSLAPYRTHRKIYVEKHGLQIPMREVELGGGEEPVRLYDTSGPRVSGHEEGLPRLREPWVAARSGTRGISSSSTRVVGWSTRLMVSIGYWLTSLCRRRARQRSNAERLPPTPNR